MANNRLYLVHRPSMVGVYLGKRMACGWYGSDGAGPRIADLFAYVEQNQPTETQDEFVVFHEGSDEWNQCTTFDGDLLRFEKYP